MNVLIIDGQGGQLGARLVKEIAEKMPEVTITAVGTNATATSAMLKAGAKQGATGENPVVVAAKKADVIMGPVGIVITDSLLGEVTERMAVAVGRANATRILIPVNKCENLIAGVPSLNLSELTSDAVSKLKDVFNSKNT